MRGGGDCAARLFLSAAFVGSGCGMDEGLFQNSKLDPHMRNQITFYANRFLSGRLFLS